MKVMNMKYFVKILGIFVAGSVIVSSCGKDYLNTTPTDSVSADLAVSNFQNAYASLNGIAETMCSQQYMGNQGDCGENAVIRLFENYPSQNYTYNAYASGWSTVHNMGFCLSKTSKYGYYAWYYYYNIIGQANTIIARIDESSATDEEKAFVKGAALTFRAYGYQKLLQYYSPRWVDSNNGSADAVPLRIDESTGDCPIATQAEVYAQIYADCEEAISQFGKTSVTREEGDVWIPNVNVAHAVYARAALTRQDYSKALSEAKLAEDGYPLVSGANYNDGFCQPNSEWIFGSFGDETENQWYWTYGTQFSCNGYYASASSNGAGGINIELTDQITDNNDVRKALFLTADKFPSFNADNVDKTQGYLGFTINGGKVQFTNENLYMEVDAYVSSHAASGFTAPLSAGFYRLGDHMKYYVFGTPGVGYLPFIRTSEMVLIEAEANYFLKNESAAQAALNKLNVETGRTTYTCTTTGEKLLKDIQNYRELELWGEGFGFSDYKRWKLPIDRKGLANGGNIHAAIAVKIGVDEKNGWTYSVPERESLYNKAIGGGSETAE